MGVHIFSVAQDQHRYIAYPDFNWRTCFWISLTVGTSWLMGNLFEIFGNSWTNSGKLPLSSLGTTESTKLVGLKFFWNGQRSSEGDIFQELLSK